MYHNKIKEIYKKNIYLLITTIFIISSFVFINNSNAQEISDLLPDLPPELSLPQMAGHIKGEGVHFEITNSEYLNLKLDSSEPIKLTLESIPEMITMMIESSTSTITTSTQIILSGFSPLTTYYKYEDDYHNLIGFTTDENGIHSYIQDLSKLHLVFIQPRKSTKFIKDDATGGDCYLIGNWDELIKTCTLTKDLNETIQIDSNNIILDGNGHTITGSNTGSGIYLSGRSDVTIKNLKIQRFSYGIYIRSSSGNTLINNTMSLNGWYGIYLNYSPNNILTNNIINFHSIGIFIIYSNNNILTNNSANSNGDGIYLYSSRGSVLTSNTVNLNDIGISLFYSNNNTLTSNTADSNRYRGISIYSSSNNGLTSNVASANNYGINLYYYSDNNILTKNNVNLNNKGIHIRSASGNVLTGNTAISNMEYGILIDSTGVNPYSNSNNILRGNTMISNKYNFYLYGQSDLDYNNDIDSSNTVDGKPIYYIKNAVNQIYDSSTNAGIFYCIFCNNITIQDLTLTKNGAGIYLWKTQNSNIKNNIVNSNDNNGIYLNFSNNNIIRNNIASSNDQGIYFNFSSDNTLTNNTVNFNWHGIILDYSNNNTLISNTVTSNNSGGIILKFSSNNTIYNNNFIDNPAQVYVYGGNNVFNLAFPIGGNYWSNFDKELEGCYDNNFDNICNSPYIFTGGQDNLPWKIKDGWLLPPQPPQIIKPTIGGKIKSTFDYYDDHQGIDIDKSLYQTPVAAAAGGIIVRIDNIDDSNAGKWIWIYHGDITKLDGTVVNKISTRYLHLDTIDSSISVGQQITQGIIIGTVGKTGSINYVPHLHFEVRQGDIPADLDYRKTTALDPLGFVDYPVPEFFAAAFSPVDIIVTDPDGLIISKTKNDFGDNADYFAPKYIGIFDDGEPIKEFDSIAIALRKDGDYLINIIPEVGAQPDDIYTLKTSVCGIITSLSENTPVKYIPDQPYIVRLNGCTAERIIPTKIITQTLESEYLLNSQLQIQFSAIDNIFDTASISATLNGNTVDNNQIITLDKFGSNVFIVTAIDNNGNITTLTKTFNVVYGFGGFLPPIKNDGSGVYNLRKTLPVKFQLTDVNGNFISTALAQLYLAKISDGIIGNDEIPLSVSSADVGNQFRYDFTNNQYIYNLSIDTLSVGSWQLKAILDSGQVFIAIISVK